MQLLNHEQLTNAFRQVGLHDGCGLLVHSAVQYLGQPVDGLNTYLKAFDDVIGIPGLSNTEESARPKTGTIAVPAFNFGFARGELFDPATTRSIGMGSFSEFIRRHPNSRRTAHPMQSLAVLGYYADDLSSRDTPSAFDPGSVFERMIELDFDLLLLGADIQAVSLMHYSEQRYQVPYRYWKDFQGTVRTPKGFEQRTYRMYVRDLEIDAQLSLHPVQRVLEARGQWQSAALNYGKIASCHMRDFFDVLDEFLLDDPWSLVMNRSESHQPETNQ
jgi:aminoglycoside 3-N-acetyltransferase